jgi:Zn-dependent peptidase ImmA (M78 family)/transcriptional regulator with XRE-family HTH domain
MSFDRERLGTKLRKYREQFQRTQEEVAAVTGISPKDLASYEAGQDLPSGDEILILADYYKCDFKFFISNDLVAPFEQTETLFRRYGKELSRDDRWAIQEFLFLCECEEYLVTELQPFGRTPFQFIKRGKHFKTHADDAASALRDHLGYKTNEVGLNVYKDLRTIGFHVFRRQLANSSISGLYIHHPVAGKCVLVNFIEDVYRQQFTAAHEAAHAILDDGHDVNVSFTRWDRGDLSEIRANTFASRFLMPPELLRAIPNTTSWTTDKTIEWAGKLKVSTTALAYALASAGIVTNAEAEQLRTGKLKAAQKNDPELPTSLSPKVRERRETLLKRGLSSFYVELCFEALHRGTISLSRTAEMLLTDERDVVSVAQLFGVPL